jgi:hypothetical protein
MPTPYDEMWKKLNLDLTAHEGLLQVLGKFYGDIYLTGVADALILEE